MTDGQKKEKEAKMCFISQITRQKGRPFSTIYKTSSKIIHQNHQILADAQSLTQMTHNIAGSITSSYNFDRNHDG